MKNSYSRFIYLIFLVIFLTSCKPVVGPKVIVQMPEAEETVTPDEKKQPDSTDPILIDEIEPDEADEFDEPDEPDEPDEEDLFAEAEQEASPEGRKVLVTGRIMTLETEEIIRGGCWDYANAVYNRAGFPSYKRRVIFRGTKRGPFADIRLIRPGDWLYIINQSYGKIEHSGIFVHWVDYEHHKGMLLSYAGERRREPARYLTYDLTEVYRIIRPKPDSAP